MENRGRYDANLHGYTTAKLEKRLKKVEKQSSFETTFWRVFHCVMIYMAPLFLLLILATAVEEYFPNLSMIFKVLEQDSVRLQ